MTNNDEERGKKENKCHNRDKIKNKNCTMTKI